MSDNNMRERVARLEEQVKNLHIHINNNKSAIHEIDRKIDEILTNDIPHLQNRSRGDIAKIFGVGGIGALIIEVCIRYVAPLIINWFSG